nr:reverse transcriptase domain-containing protein [Tanacetum cinerariifolium]
MTSWHYISSLIFISPFAKANRPLMPELSWTVNRLNDGLVKCLPMDVFACFMAPFGGVTDWYQSRVIENQVVRQGTTIENNANNKRKFKNQPKDNHVPQQPPFKKPNVARAYTIGSNEKKAYAGNLPYCNKCKLHHVGPCTVKCGNYKRTGHMTRDCKASIAAMNQRAHVANPKATIT